MVAKKRYLQEYHTQPYGNKFQRTHIKGLQAEVLERTAHKRFLGHF